MTIVEDVITKNNITKKKATKLLNLIEQWTRAEIMSRFSDFPRCGDFYATKLDKENEIRELVFDSSILLELAERWELVQEGRNNGKEKSKKGKKSKIKNARLARRGTDCSTKRGKKRNVKRVHMH